MTHNDSQPDWVQDDFKDGTCDQKKGATSRVKSQPLTFHLIHILTVYLAFYLTCYLFYLTHILTFYLAFYLTFHLFNLTYILTVYSDILVFYLTFYHILSALSDICSDILSSTLNDTYAEILCGILTFYPASTLTFYLAWVHAQHLELAASDREGRRGVGPLLVKTITWRTTLI